MALSAAQRKANDKYIKENYRQVKLSMPKEEAEILEIYCANRGLKKAGFIRAAIKEKMQRDRTQPTKASAQQEPTPEEQPTKPQSFLESVRAGVEQIVAETDKDAEEEGWENWKKHNTF